jgi:hypothetical protein
LVTSIGWSLIVNRSLRFEDDKINDYEFV